jgi:hypothetical protein
MATLWLKDEKPGEQPKKRFMDKRAVRLLLEKKDAAHVELKRQIHAANWTMAVMEQRIKDMSDERKWLFLAILVLVAFLVTSGIFRWL